TWFDRTNYFETVTATGDNLRWALGLEADRMVNSKMDKALLDREMTVVRNEFERGENSPQRVLAERVIASAYLWHNYGKSTIGSRADIENVPIHTLDAFYRRYYQPDNAMLVIAGQFDPPKALGFVAETLGKLPRPIRRLDATYTTEPVQDGERYVALRRVGDGQAIMIAYHIPSAAHPDSAALAVLAGVMTGGGGGRGGAGAGAGTGRLYKALVDNKKAVSVRMSADQWHDPGLASVGAQLSADQSLAEARKIITQTVEGLAAEPPTAEEVDRARTRLIRGMEMRMTDTQSVGLNLSEWVAMGDWRLMFLHRDRVKNVTPQDVVRVSKSYFMESNRTVGEFIPTAKPERAEVPATPDFDALFKDYRGGEAISQGESFDPTPANVESRVVRAALPGGLKLVMLPRKTRGGTVNALVQLHFGDEKSLAGKTAAAQLAGALLMRGTRTKTRQQIQDEMDRLRARITVSAGGGGGFGGGRRGPAVTSGISDAVATIETTTANFEAALRLAVEMLREPAFNEADFEQVRRQRIAAIESTRSEPQTLASTESRRRLSPFTRDDPRYTATLDEQIADLKKVTLDDARKFHEQFYGASSGEVVAIGQFEPAALRKTAESLLGGWQSAAPYQRLTTPFKKAEAANLKIETPDKQNAVFDAGLRFQMSDDDPDYAALLLANQMFGGGLGARMPNRIRNVEGLSYSVSSRVAIPTTGDGALFTASAISAPQNTPKVESSFKDELAKTLKGGFTADEAATAKRAWRDQQMVSRSQEESLLRVLASREHAGRTMKWDEQLEAKIAALTVEQINTAFRRHIDPAGLVIVEAGDFKK
ncbi:MAG: M16 family metallopeptidase, partial [Bryobacteraceae bacterium]